MSAPGEFVWTQMHPHAELAGQLYVFGGAWNRFSPGDQPNLARLGVRNDLWRCQINN